MTILALDPLSVPLHLDETGTMRVGGTRVTLDVLLSTYETEGSAEGVVECIDVLDLTDVYLVLAWCRKHPEAVATYRQRREREAEELRQQLQASGITPTPDQAAALAAQLRARWAQREAQNNAAPGQ